MKKAVVLLSGGLDSAVTLYLAIKRNREVYPFAVRHKQTNIIELDRAKDLCDSIGRSLFVGEADCWPINGSGYKSGRNMVLIAMAAAYAESRDASEVWTGLIGGNKNKRVGPVMADSCAPFHRAMQKLMDTDGVGKWITLCSPFLEKRKTDVVLTGKKLGVPFEKTWTCYTNREVPCGICSACVDRTFAFAEAGVEDPLWGWGAKS